MWYLKLFCIIKIEVFHYLTFSDCGSNPADIHFLIDASGSVGQTNFDKQLEFVKNFAKEFNISSNAVRIGVTTFDSKVHQQFWMNEHMNENDLKAAVSKIQFTGRLVNFNLLYSVYFNLSS